MLITTKLEFSVHKMYSCNKEDIRMWLTAKICIPSLQKKT